MILGDNEAANEVGEVQALETKRDEDAYTFKCNTMGLVDITEANNPKNTDSVVIFMGSLMDIPIVVLVDPGVRHNFILSEVMTISGRVRLGDGQQVSTTWKCLKLEVHLVSFTAVVVVYVMELDAVNMFGSGVVKKAWEGVTRLEGNDTLFPVAGEGVELEGQFTLDGSTEGVQHIQPDLRPYLLRSLLREEGMKVVTTDALQ